MLWHITSKKGCYKKRKTDCAPAQEPECLTWIASVGMNSTEQCVFATKSASTPYVPAHLSSPITLLLPIESLSNSCQEKIKLKVWSLNSKDPRVKTWRTFEPPSRLISSEASDPSIGSSTLTWNTHYKQNRCKQHTILTQKGIFVTQDL